MTAEERERIRRWEAKVDKTGDCWPWLGRLDRYGYGKFYLAGRDLIAHRWGYLTFVGPIADGLVLDHVCRNRACCNPEHLEPVTQRVNLLRGDTFQAMNASKTECIRGHEYTPENTWLDGRGFRNCRICKRSRRSRSNARPS